jgi:hypothetical protein
MGDKSSLARAATKATADQRASGRQRRRLKISWRLLGEQDGLFSPGHLRDISRSGAAAYLDTPVKQGSILLLKLEDVPGWTSDPYLVRVRHVAALSGVSWLAGFSFTRRFTEEEFAVLLDATQHLAPAADLPRATNGGVEKRKTTRRGGPQWQPIRIKAVNILRPETIGRVRDHCTDGLGIVSLVAFPVGTVLNVRADQPEVSGANWVQVRVRYCRPYERQWIIGCEFTGKLLPRELAQFI